MPNTADLARKLPFEDRITLLRLALGEPVAPSANLTRKALVDVVDGRPALSDVGTRVTRHLDAGHRVQVRGRMVRILERVLAAQTVDGEVEQEIARLAPDELDLFAAALDRVRAALPRG